MELRGFQEYWSNTSLLKFNAFIFVMCSTVMTRINSAFDIEWPKTVFTPEALWRSALYKYSNGLEERKRNIACNTAVTWKHGRAGNDVRAVNVVWGTWGILASRSESLKKWPRGVQWGSWFSLKPSQRHQLKRADKDGVVPRRCIIGANNRRGYIGPRRILAQTERSGSMFRWWKTSCIGQFYSERQQATLFN